MAERLNKKEFESRISQRDKPVLIDFYSDSCVPCKRMAPVLAELEEVYADAVFVGKVNIAYETELAEAYQVQSAPTILFFWNGKEEERFIGVKKKRDFEEVLNRMLQLNK
ncbi:MAG: thioredoxin [Clostridiaceae bacterium]|nr:thioredoxin [Clostridiaceae bacterium]